VNGRCEKDALDRAEDICELCGAQFCAACLLFPRGHRNPPTCKSCALENSGLRGTKKGKSPISRREYKKRKQQLLTELEGVEDDAPPIEYFELADPSKFDRSNELDRRQEEIIEPDTIDILGRLDEAAPAAPEPSPLPAAAAAEPPVESDMVDSGAALAGLAPVDTSVNPLALASTPRPPSPSQMPAPSSAPAEEPASEASTTAADLLARLKADQPIHSQFSSAPRSLDADPFAAAPATPTPDPHPAATQAPITPAPDEPLPAAQPFSDAANTPAVIPVRTETNPFAAPTPTPTPTPERKRPVTEPWTPPVAPPRGSNLDRLDSQSPAFDEPAVPDALVAHTAAPDASDSEDHHDASEASLADTDTSGQWIPPSLRGMASPNARAADPLPKRR